MKNLIPQECPAFVVLTTWSAYRGQVLDGSLNEYGMLRLNCFDREGRCCQLMFGTNEVKPLTSAAKALLDIIG